MASTNLSPNDPVARTIISNRAVQLVVNALLTGHIMTQIEILRREDEIRASVDQVMEQECKDLHSYGDVNRIVEQIVNDVVAKFKYAGLDITDRWLTDC